MMENNFRIKNILAITIAVVILFGSLFYLYKYISKPSIFYPGKFESQETPYPSGLTSLNVNFISSTPLWKKGSTQEVTLSFSDPNNIPLAFSLSLEYDPTKLRILKVDPGDLWTSNNVLQNYNNEEKGTLLYVVGQGFDAKNTGSLKFATISFSVLQNSGGSVNLKLGNDSAATKIDIDQLIALKADSYNITITD